MRKITRSENPEKSLRMKSKWNASGSTLAMNRQTIDAETVVYAMMCALIASLILTSVLPMVCHAAGSGGGDFSSLTSGLTTLAKNFYDSLIVKVIGVGAGVALALAFLLRIGAPGSELERRLHGWPMKIIFALFGVAVAPSVVSILITQLKAANFFTFNL